MPSTSTPRSNPSDLFGSPPHYGLSYFGVSKSGSCTDKPMPCPENREHNYCQTKPAKNQCELPPVKNCPPCPAPASRIATGYHVKNQTVAQGDFSGCVSTRAIPARGTRLPLLCFVCT
jgi:hypothetical protein